MVGTKEGQQSFMGSPGGGLGPQPPRTPPFAGMRLTAAAVKEMRAKLAAMDRDEFAAAHRATLESELADRFDRGPRDADVADVDPKRLIEARVYELFGVDIDAAVDAVMALPVVTERVDATTVAARDALRLVAGLPDLVMVDVWNRVARSGSMPHVVLVHRAFAGGLTTQLKPRVLV